MRMRALPLIATAALVLAPGASAAPNPCASGNCSVTPPNAWAKVRAGLGTSTPLAYPRATQGAVLRTVRLVTQPEQPYDPTNDFGEPITTCGGSELRATYRTPGGRKVGLIIGTSENTSPGCGVGSAAGYRCTTGHLSRVTGVVLTCRGPHGRRGLSWSGPSWGYWLDAPARFPIAAMAQSTR